MIAVIQCASGKRSNAGHLKTRAGIPVTFVAKPTAAPAEKGMIYAHPDDASDHGGTWRQELLKYNKNPGINRLGLLPAWHLYENRAYAELAKHVGLDKLFILSAGWGLVRAGFLLPYYDITFSSSAEAYKRRREGDVYRDKCMPPPDLNDDIKFFGGKHYVPQFCELTAKARAKKIVYYNSKNPPDAPGCGLRRFQTSTRTNWHYECVKAFIEGKLDEP